MGGLFLEPYCLEIFLGHSNYWETHTKIMVHKAKTCMPTIWLTPPHGNAKDSIGKIWVWENAKKPWYCLLAEGAAILLPSLDHFNPSFPSLSAKWTGEGIGPYTLGCVKQTWKELQGSVHILRNQLLPNSGPPISPKMITWYVYSDRNIWHR